MYDKIRFPCFAAPAGPSGGASNDDGAPDSLAAAGSAPADDEVMPPSDASGDGTQGSRDGCR